MTKFHESRVISKIDLKREGKSLAIEEFRHRTFSS